MNYICEALRLSRGAFNLDLPLPLEDWSDSADMALILSGLYLSTMRRAFYEALFAEHPETRHGPAWVNHADAEFWYQRFNYEVHRRNQGVILSDPRVKH